MVIPPGGATGDQGAARRPMQNAPTGEFAGRGLKTRCRSVSCVAIVATGLSVIQAAMRMTSSMDSTTCRTWKGFLRKWS